MRDVQFLSALIDRLEAAYTIDPLRIYANGMSNGGAMALALACTLADRIAAVGTVARQAGVSRRRGLGGRMGAAESVRREPRQVGDGS